MFSRYPRILYLILVSLLFSSFLYTKVVLALDNYVASSSNYRIAEDALSSGGLLSTSTSYSLQSSLSGLSSETSTSSSYSIRSGHLQMATAYLAVSAPSNVSMSPAIYTSGGGVGNGSASWMVTTDSSGGYSLSIKASTAPALKSATDSFANYTTQVAGVPDYTFAEGAATDFFGFSPEGADIRSLYKDDGTASCNTGSSDTANKCWDSVTTSNKIVAIRSSPNHTTGTLTTIKFRAGAGSLIHKIAGSYGATITLTVLPL